VPADTEVVVASAAIKPDNPEIRAARELGVPVVSRADFLGDLMAAHKGPKIAVAGTHGKTTTTAMLGVILERAGWDPTVFVGGEVAALGGNLRIGGDDGPFVAEACEAYDSFHSLRPDIAIVTNVEADHLDHYGTPEAVVESFRRFLGNLEPNSGKLVAWSDDPGVRAVLAGLSAGLTLFDYGIEPKRYAGSRGANVATEGATAFDWHFDAPCVRIVMRVPGIHNVLNALAAATVARLLGVSRDAVAEGLAGFSGTARRQETLGEPSFETGSVLVIDDYAHHPTEIRATLAALRSAHPGRRLLAVFQPHLYSRTRDFLPEFAAALAAPTRLSLPTFTPRASSLFRAYTRPTS